MAFDEYCLQEYPSDASFFYLWRNRPSVIIGLNQNAFSEVNLKYLDDHGITLARRVTGGGAVYHDLQNLNYTFVGESVSTEPFVEALRSLGVKAEVTGRNDIFVDGRKVSGYARRVWRNREIIHGTLMYDVDLDTLTRVLDVPGSKMDAKGIASVKSRVGNLKSLLPEYPSLEALQAKLQQLLSAGDPQLPFTEEMRSAVQKMSDEKFSTWDWVYGRSHAADIVKSGRLACGTVEPRICIDRGVITDITFGGDFLGGLDPQRLSDSLKGVRYDYTSVLETLSGEEVERFFDNVTAKDLTELIIN